MADFVMDNEDNFLINQDPRPYLFEQEHTEEELQVLEEERARREAEAAEQPGAGERLRAGMNWWCSCGACKPMPSAERLVSEKHSSHLPRLLSL